MNTLILIILILIILILIILIILIIINFNFNETFLSDYSDYNKIDRIKVGTNYAYCIGGNITCPSNMTKLNDDYNGGKTYSCESPMTCNNFTLSTNLDISGEKYLWNTPTPKSIPLPFSTIYKGFTYPTPTPYIPIKLEGNYFSIYDNDSSNTLLDTMNKCSIINDTYRCEMATHSLDNSFGDASFVTTQLDKDISNIYQEQYPILSNLSDTKNDFINKGCIADYGSNIGDNLCDGTMGLIKDTAYVCPRYKPICDYKCGSELGQCNYRDKSM
jgi:hypothetical protein